MLDLSKGFNNEYSAIEKTMVMNAMVMNAMVMNATAKAKAMAMTLTRVDLSSFLIRSFVFAQNASPGVSGTLPRGNCPDCDLSKK